MAQRKIDDTRNIHLWQHISISGYVTDCHIQACGATIRLFSAWRWEQLNSLHTGKAMSENSTSAAMEDGSFALTPLEAVFITPPKGLCHSPDKAIDMAALGVSNAGNYMPEE